MDDGVAPTCGLANGVSIAKIVSRREVEADRVVAGVAQRRLHDATDLAPIARDEHPHEPRILSVCAL